MSVVEDQVVETPGFWAEQILENHWGRLVDDPIARTLSYVPNDRPRQLAAHLYPISQRSDALDRELRQTTELLTRIAEWFRSAGEFMLPVTEEIESQLEANNRLFGKEPE